ncbi:MAG: SGNH/GDSL hydrolase family protein, partial [Candidatus Krumholzibacteria bacterium]|nr:SGNH/GDSL hydrolase family protein [Candidatus Krumholzibacteria bacterium]
MRPCVGSARRWGRRRQPRAACAGLGASCAILACLVTYAVAGGALPRSPSELLLVGDSVTAGIYFLSLNAKSIRQAWSGQLIRRLGMEPPRAPYDITYPINHLGLAELGFTAGGLAYAWEARQALRGGSPRFTADEERIVMAVPGQTVEELLRQSSRTKSENKHSSGWTFGRFLLPKGLSAMETIEQWEKRPRWVVLFIGANDLLASFDMVGKITSPSPEEFRSDYEELVRRLRAVMAADAPPEQFLVLTLPDVTKLPLLQALPPSADDGHGHRYPPGSMAS